MSRDLSPPEFEPQADSQFATTRWSVVLAAAHTEDPSASQRALAELCQAYWYPVYAYVRRRVARVHEAQDLTQAFFEQLLEREWLATADPGRGHFRGFLLTACKRFLANHWHRAHAAKRGGRCRRLSLDFAEGDAKYAAGAVDSLTPERLYEQQWAIALLGRVLQRLREECDAKGKLRQFQHLKPFLSGSGRGGDHATVAEALGVSAGAVKVAAHRLRVRYRELLRSEIAQTVNGSEEIDEEIRRLFTVLGAS